MENTMDAAFQHAKHIAEYLNKCSSTYIVHVALKELGVPSDREGFLLAKHTIRMLLENPSLTLINGVYSAAGALVLGSSGDRQVETAIRRAIQAAWKNREEKLWACYFPVGREGRTKCPSNKVFLMAVVDFVILWQGCCEEVNYGKCEHS